MRRESCGWQLSPGLFFPSCCVTVAVVAAAAAAARAVGGGERAAQEDDGGAGGGERRGGFAQHEDVDQEGEGYLPYGGRRGCDTSVRRRAARGRHPRRSEGLGVQARRPGWASRLGVQAGRSGWARASTEPTITLVEALHRLYPSASVSCDRVSVKQ